MKQAITTISAIMQIPATDITSIEILKGGLTNDAWKFTTLSGDYVLRLPGKGSNQMIPRSEESVHEQLVTPLNIDAPLVYFDAESGIKICKFIHGQTMNANYLQNPEHLQGAARLLRTLHDAGLESEHHFDLFGKLQRYETLADTNNATYYENYTDVREHFHALRSEIESNHTPILCHNDLVAENILFDTTAAKHFLIDWEYSGMNDPLFDIAGLALEAEFNTEQLTAFLTFYGKDSAEIRRRILLHQISQDVLWSVWGLYKHALGQISYDYGLNRYNRALRLMDEVNR